MIDIDKQKERAKQMKIHRRLNKAIIFICVLLWFGLTMYCSRVLASESSYETASTVSEEEMPAILGLIGDSIRDNYEKIQTWSGEIDVKMNWIWTGTKAEDLFEKLTDRTGETPKGLLQKVEEKVAFAVDVKKGFVYVDCFRGTPCKFLNLTTGKELAASSGPYSSGPHRSTSIATEDYIVEAEPGRWDINFNLTNMKAVKKPSQKQSGTGLYNGIDDPRKVFMPEGNPWEHFNSLVKQINKLNKLEVDGHKFKIEELKKEQVTEYKIIQPASMKKEVTSPEDYVIFTKTYSSQYAFNIIYWEIKSGSGKLGQLYTWEYELVDNVYLPKRVVKKQYYSNGELSSEKDCAYTNNKVNQDIPPETFEMKNLKLKDGDVFVDEIENKKYTYKAATGTLAPLEK